MSIYQTLDPPSPAGSWTSIDWNKAERVLARLQHRLVLAVKEGDKRQVRNLQRLITKSMAARFIAVRRVAHLNQGKNTPGVDGVLWTTPQQKHDAALALTQRVEVKPLRRQWIPKSNGKLRPLGIPTMRDRAYQGLWNLALQPIVETLSDPKSCGFRPYRGASDALNILHTKLGRADRTEWVLDADIEGCFDNISHDWLLANTPMEKKVLAAFLKAGVMEGGVLSPTDIGTPQGGTISATLCNHTLNGIEGFLEANFKNGYSGKLRSQRRMHRTGIMLVRYADDFVVTGRSERQLLRVKVKLADFLAPRGLKLSEAKTHIRHIKEGFDFLGWTFRVFNSEAGKGTLLVRTSAKIIRRHMDEIKSFVKGPGNAMPAGAMVKILQSKIDGWANYHRVTSNLWDTWGKMDAYMFRCLWHWARKRHRAKGRAWLKDRYWKRAPGTKWQFQADGVKLYGYGRKQVKPVRIAAEFNPFLLTDRPKLTDQWTRKAQQKAHGGTRRRLWDKQKGTCPQCKTPLDWDGMDKHHVHPKAVGGTDKEVNLILLHEHCHYSGLNHGQLRNHKALKRSA